jgi:3-phytase
VVGHPRSEVEPVMRNVFPLLSCFVFIACATAPNPAPSVVPETFESAAYAADEIDSLAVHGDAVYVTAKKGDRLIVVDANDGTFERSIANGLRRPNGIAVAGDLAIVVERDNHRLQFFALPSGESIGIAAEDVLRRPYGIAAYESAPGVVQAYITDNHDAATADDLAQRVRHFEITRDNGRAVARLVRSFGERSGDGALQKVETIAVDPANDQLLVVEETSSRMGIRIYTLDGRFTGRVVGRDLFRSEPEGIAPISCFWVMTDQDPKLSRFHVFERGTLEHRGVFTGRITANTDGITTSSTRVYAVHDDHSVTAFDWSAVEKTLGLNCR